MIVPGKFQGLFGGLLGAGLDSSRQDFYQAIAAQQQQNAHAITLLDQAFGPRAGTSIDTLFADRQYQNAFAERRRATLKSRIFGSDDPIEVWLEESPRDETYYEWLEREGL